MGKSQKKHQLSKKRSLKIRNKSGGDLLTDIAKGFAGTALTTAETRNVFYIDWLEERLLIHFKDELWLKSTREKFKYNLTSLRNFPESILAKYCNRNPLDKKDISPYFVNDCPLNMQKIRNKAPQNNSVQQKINPIQKLPMSKYAKSVL